MRLAFIDPGRFRSELMLEMPVRTGDGMGGHVESWQEIAVVFALVEPRSARRRWAAGQVNSRVTHRVTLRSRADIATGHRFRRGSRALTILSAFDPDESARYLVCDVEETSP